MGKDEKAVEEVTIRIDCPDSYLERHLWPGLHDRQFIGITGAAATPEIDGPGIDGRKRMMIRLKNRPVIRAIAKNICLPNLRSLSLGQAMSRILFRLH